MKVLIGIAAILFRARKTRGPIRCCKVTLHSFSKLTSPSPLTPAAIPIRSIAGGGIPLRGFPKLPIPTPHSKLPPTNQSARATSPARAVFVSATRPITLASGINPGTQSFVAALTQRGQHGHFIGTDRDQKGCCSGSANAKCENTQGHCEEEFEMDTTTLLIIVLVVLLVGGGGWYGRGRWY